MVNKWQITSRVVARPDAIRITSVDSSTNVCTLVLLHSTIVIMSTDEFTKLFRYMEEFRSEVNARFDDTSSKEDTERVLGLLDSIAKRQEISDDERLVVGHQLDRLDRWTHELANKIGYKLSV